MFEKRENLLKTWHYKAQVSINQQGLSFYFTPSLNFELKKGVSIQLTQVCIMSLCVNSESSKSSYFLNPLLDYSNTIYNIIQRDTPLF